MHTRKASKGEYKVKLYSYLRRSSKLLTGLPVNNAYTKNESSKFASF